MEVNTESVALKCTFQVTSREKLTVWRSSQRGYYTILCKTLNHDTVAALKEEMESCIAKDYKPLVYMVVMGNSNEKMIRHVPALELKQHGVQLPHNFHGSDFINSPEYLGDMEDQDDSYLEFNSYVYLVGINDNGSIHMGGTVIVPKLEKNVLVPVMWTMIDGVNMVRSCFNTGIRYPETSDELVVYYTTLNDMTGCIWSLTDCCKLLKLCSSNDLESLVPPSYQQSVLGIGNVGIIYYVDDPGNPILVQKNLAMKLVGAIDQTLSFIGENAQDFINSGLPMMLMIAFPVFQSNGIVLKTGLDYVRLGAAASSTMFTIITWIFSKSKKPILLANTIASCAMLSMLLGVFCAIFAPLPLPYLSCFIIACMMIVLSAGYYASQP